MRMRFFISYETNVRNCKMCIHPLFNIGHFLTPNIRANVCNGSQQAVHAHPFTEISENNLTLDRGVLVMSG